MANIASSWATPPPNLQIQPLALHVVAPALARQEAVIGHMANHSLLSREGRGDNMQGQRLDLEVGGRRRPARGNVGHPCGCPLWLLVGFRRQRGWRLN